MACKVARAAWAEGGDHPSLGVLTSTRGAICDQSPGALSWSGPKQGTKPLCLPQAQGFPCEEEAGGEGHLSGKTAHEEHMYSEGPW